MPPCSMNEEAGSVSTFRNIGKILKKAQFSSPIGVLYDHAVHSGKISVDSVVVTGVADYLNHYDYYTHPAELISESAASAILGIFIPQLLSNIVNSYVGDPQISLAIALTVTTAILKFGIDICDKFTPPLAQAEEVADKPLTKEEKAERRDLEIQQLETSIDARNDAQAAEDAVLESALLCLR